MSRDVSWHKFTKNELRTGKTFLHDVAILNCTIVILIFGKIMSSTGSVNETTPRPRKKRELNTSQAEPLAANSRAVGQFLSISCEAFI